ncbi:MAG: NtaA/DmoA family FMN-dependent monooxygenase [Anaerolineae bacterium]
MSKSEIIHLNAFTLYEPDLGIIFPSNKTDAKAPWTDIRYWEEIAQIADRGLLDAIFFADFWGGTNDRTSIRYGERFPLLDPLLLVPRLSAVAKRVGFMVTMSTSFYNPYMVARKMQTLDHITNGRVAWNVVTSVNQAEGGQLGLVLPDHDKRYEMAYEFVDLVKKLWDSWDEDALVMDYGKQIVSDPDKVRRVDFEGEWFKSTGPLSVHRGPQGQPVLVQAGSSAEGTKFAGRNAEVIFGPGAPLDIKKKMVDRWRSAISDAGRDPHSVRILFPVGGVVRSSRLEAQEMAAQIGESIPDEICMQIVSQSAGFDLSDYSPHTPVREIVDQVTGYQGIFNIAAERNQTLLELGRFMENKASDERYVGNPADVADGLESEIDTVGSDGFMLRATYYKPDYFGDMIDLLVPELQRRGRARTAYAGNTLRSYVTQRHP